MHCVQIAAKANTRTKLTQKVFLFYDTQSLTRAFTTFVRPILEYNTPVWCPYLKIDISLSLLKMLNILSLVHFFTYVTLNLLIVTID